MRRWFVVILTALAVAVTVTGCQKQKAEVAEKAPPGAAATSPGTSTTPSGGTPAGTQVQGE
ncbi:MAG: hypothetical protein RMM06_01695 [Armatimonadota bacterium]|nr:hypothetical protein [bacterium]MCS7310769.1 hypothetical protein [Armatimonadota bacterium]MDW8105740.1 hypothetical protein [Armatimonadota bacterium]MDW8289409.1 hypothetical protein [Armatimonadota bacterium]